MNPWVIDPLNITLRLLLALFLGGLIGLERERSNHAAGFRTNILVCVGSALIMLLSIYGFPEFANEPNVRMDPARLAAQVISGIGFLGAGTILRNGLSVTGLTTAASLWVVAAIGLAAGAGFYYPAVLATGMVLISLWVLNIFENKFFRAKRIQTLHITTSGQAGTLGLIAAILKDRGIEIRKLMVEEEEKEDGSRMHIEFTLKIPKPNQVIPVIEKIRELPGVHTVAID